MDKYLNDSFIRQEIQCIKRQIYSGSPVNPSFGFLNKSKQPLNDLALAGTKEVIEQSEVVKGNIREMNRLSEMIDKPIKDRKDIEISAKTKKTALLDEKND